MSTTDPQAIARKLLRDTARALQGAVEAANKQLGYPVVGWRNLPFSTSTYRELANLGLVSIHGLPDPGVEVTRLGSQVAHARGEQLRRRAQEGDTVVLTVRTAHRARSSCADVHTPDGNAVVVKTVHKDGTVTVTGAHDNRRMPIGDLTLGRDLLIIAKREGLLS